MLLTRVRVRPCSALCCGSSDGRVTVSVPFSSVTVMSAGSVRVSSPRGPFTVIVLPFCVIVTPLGTVTGSLPIRDMGAVSLPDEGEELAARALLARLTVAEDPLRGAEDRDPEAVAD